MAFLPLVELAVTLLFATFIATQIVWPIVHGEPWFPILRAKRGLEKQLNELHGEEEEIELKKRIVALKKELEEKASQVNTTTQKKGNK